METIFFFYGFPYAPLFINVCPYLFINVCPYGRGRGANTKEHLTQFGLEQIISIKSILNWGNSELIMNTFLNIKPIEKLSYITSEIPQSLLG